jgi:hypothetical protein
MSNQTLRSKLSFSIGMLAAGIAEKMLDGYTIPPEKKDAVTRTFDVLVTQTMMRTISVTVDDTNAVSAMTQAAALAAEIQDADWELLSDPLHVECRIVR